MIQTVKQRAALKPRGNQPYFIALGMGRFVGYRKADDGAGTWYARFYDTGAKKNVQRSLGDFASLPDSERYGAAVKAAGAIFAHLEGGGAKDDCTVREACESYVKKLARDKSEEAAKDAESRYARHVYSDPIAGIYLRKLTPTHCDNWRTRLSERKTIPQKRGERCRSKRAPAIRPRSASTINRDMMPLRAALNHAYALRKVTSDYAWSETLKDIKDAGGRRDLTLTREERERFSKAAGTELRPFVWALCSLPMRPGAIAKLTVANFNSFSGELTVGKDKTGKDRKVVLPLPIAQHFATACKGKTPAAPIFNRDDGSRWTKDKWKGPIAKAVKLAKLPHATAYTLRHTAITDLVSGGLDINAVAKLSGTSVAMIEKHYAHLRQDKVTAALAKLAIR